MRAMRATRVPLWAVVVVAACGGMPEVPAPVGEGIAAPEAVLVWVGRGATERYDGEHWVRDPRFDYAFVVEQRRGAGRWESFKTMRRQHPDYDGSAGPREQVLWFEVAYGPLGDDGAVVGAVRSRLGPGEVVTDAAFRDAVIILRPDISERAPFDTVRIVQRYLYEAGRLEEVVELVDHIDGVEVPWVRNVERATLFGPTAFDGPPTRR